jgi:hypothetical protein
VIARVLVAVDSADDLPLVDAACALAQEHRATLEIVGGIARAAPTVALVACPRALNTELEQYSCAVLCDAVRRVPPDLPVVWRQVRGCARHQVLHAAEDDDRRLVLVRRLPWWARGALRRRLRRLVVVPEAPVSPPAEAPAALPERAGTPA